MIKMLHSIASQIGTSITMVEGYFTTTHLKGSIRRSTLFGVEIQVKEEKEEKESEKEQESGQIGWKNERKEKEGKIASYLQSEEVTFSLPKVVVSIL